jgi:hypothetical protein
MGSTAVLAAVVAATAADVGQELELVADRGGGADLAQCSRRAMLTAVHRPAWRVRACAVGWPLVDVPPAGLGGEAGRSGGWLAVGRRAGGGAGRRSGAISGLGDGGRRGRGASPCGALAGGLPVEVPAAGRGSAVRPGDHRAERAPRSRCFASPRMNPTRHNGKKPEVRWRVACRSRYW